MEWIVLSVTLLSKSVTEDTEQKITINGQILQEFVETQITKARQSERERIQKNIYILRQLINEGHITDVNKMIANEYLEKVLLN